MAGLLDQVAPASAGAGSAPPPASAGAGSSLLDGVKPPASAGASSRDVSLGERFAANFGEGRANTLAGAMGLYLRAGAAARDRATASLAAIDAARAAGSAEGVPPPAYDAANLGFGPALAEDPFGTALARNEGKPVGEMLTERTEQLARADALKRQAAAEELQRQRDFAALPPATGVLGKVAATAGYLAGGAATPESALPVGRTGTLLGTLVKGAMVNAATTVATDPIVQRAQIDVGTRKTYDPSQTLLSALIGGVAGGSLNVAPDIIVGLVRRVGSLLRKAPAAVTVGDVRATAPQMEDLDPTLRRALEAEGVLAKPSAAEGPNLGGARPAAAAALATAVEPAASPAAPAPPAAAGAGSILDAVKPLPAAAATTSEDLLPSPRLPWPKGMPDIIVHHPRSSNVWINEHPDYAAAKSGDRDAASRLVDYAMTDKAIAAARNLIGDRKPFVVAIHGEETTGRNKIPTRFADTLADQLGLPVDEHIVMVNRPRHTKANSPHRIVSRAIFDGPVEPGRDYFIVDDAVTMGSTIADLRAYIEGKGGRVIGASTLMAAPKSEKLAVTASQLGQLRGRFPKLEPWWREQFGYGLEGLTNAEAAYLLRRQSTDEIRDRIAAARQAGDPGVLPKDP